MQNKPSYRLSGAFSPALNYLRSAQGRLFSGIAMMSALAWYLLPNKQWVFDIKACAALVVAVLTWLISLIPDPKTSEHDVALLRRFQELVDSDQITFLRRQDFGSSFECRWMAGIRRIRTEWEGANFEFDNRELERQFAHLLALIQSFCNYSALNTWLLPGSIDYAHAVPEAERGEEWSSRTHARITKLNDDAAQLADEIDAFIREARKRLL